MSRRVGGMGGVATPTQEGVQGGGRSWAERQVCTKLAALSKAKMCTPPGGCSANLGRGCANQAGGGTQLSGGLQHRVGAGCVQTWGRYRGCKAGEGMQRGGQTEGQSAPRRGVCTVEEDGCHILQGGGSCEITRGALQAPKSVGTWEECSMWSSPGSGHANPGRAGPSRQGGLCRERVGGITGGLAQPRRVCPRGRPRAPCGGRTLAGG